MQRLKLLIIVIHRGMVILEARAVEIRFALESSVVGLQHSHNCSSFSVK